MIAEELPLTGTGLDRDSDRRREPDLLRRLAEDPNVQVVTVLGSSVACAGGDASLRLQTEAAPDVASRGAAGLCAYLGKANGQAYVARMLPAEDDNDRDADDGRLAAVEPTATTRTATLRTAGNLLREFEASLATTAVALANWHRTHTHCPGCGRRTEVIDAGWVRRCPVEGTSHFPRTDPAVIMAITDPRERLLLARSAHWPEGRFSVPAGFVEPGESLAAAVRREVGEETMIRVGDLTFEGTQPWPFPASLMCGFTGTTLDENPVPDGVELAEARFFTRQELDRAWRSGQIRPPGATSIARALIEQWFGSPIPG